MWWLALTIGCAPGPGLDSDVPDTVPEVTDTCLRRTTYADRDEDGHGDPREPHTGCDVVDPVPGDDCDDDRADVHPGAIETCNGRDDDCDGTTDVGASDEAPWYADLDADGFGGGAPVWACNAPSGRVATDDDCDDERDDRHPGATEDACVDALDMDCDGALSAAVDADDDGDPVCSDCDDADPTRYAGAPEACDGVDQDCDGTPDEEPVNPPPIYADVDGDGFGAAVVGAGCAPGPNESTVPGDCDDGDATRFPGAPELCDGVLSGCGDLPADELDWDHDGVRPCDGDCDDRTGTVRPGLFDACDGRDNDCDGRADEDTLGDGQACAAASCADLHAARPDRAPGLAWIRPTRDVPGQVTCDNTLDDGGWVRCATVVYEAGVTTATYDVLGAQIGHDPGDLGSVLGTDTTRGIAHSCLDLATTERGLGVRFVPADGAPTTALFRFDAALTGWDRVLLTAGPTCTDGTTVSATPVAGTSRWLTLSDGTRRVTCDDADRRGLAVEPVADGLWLDLSDDEGDAAGRFEGTLGVPIDGELEVWVRPSLIESFPDPRWTSADGVSATVTELPVRACARTASTLTLTEGAADAGLDYVAPWPPEPIPASHDRDRHVGGGVIVEDLTGDDVADVVFTAPHGAPAVYLNDGTGTFTEVVGAGVDGEGVVAGAAVDLDADGLRDVVLAGREGVIPFRNLGGGHFQRQPALWVAPSDRRATTMAWADADGDGWVDAYIGVGGRCFVSSGRACPGTDVILRGTGPFAFQDVSALFATNARDGFALATTWIDVDDDGDLDAWVGNDGGGWNVPNRVFRNPGSFDQPWSEFSSSVGLGLGMAAMGVAFGDVDDTGHTRVIVTNVTNNVVFTRAPGAAYTSLATGVTYPGVPAYPGYLSAAWAVELADLDHDVDLDVLVAWSWLFPTTWWETSVDPAVLAAQIAPLYPVVATRNAGAWTRQPSLFADVPVSWGWRSVNPVDVDQDGALDVLMTSTYGPVSLQRSACLPRHWLEVSPRQRDANPDALGARVELASAHTDQWRVIQVGGTGAQSSREPVAHFGLGDDDVVDLRVRWPDGAVTILRDVEADRRLVVTRD